MQPAQTHMRLRQLLKYCDYWLLPDGQELLVSCANDDYQKTHSLAALDYICTEILGFDASITDADPTARKHALVRRFGAHWCIECDTLIGDRFSEAQKRIILTHLAAPCGTLTDAMVKTFGWIRIAEDSIMLPGMRRDYMHRAYRWLVSKASAAGVDEATLGEMLIGLSSPRMDCQVKVATLRRAGVRIGHTRRDFARPAQLVKEEDNMRNPTYRGKPDGD